VKINGLYSLSCLPISGDVQATLSKAIQTFVSRTIFMLLLILIMTLLSAYLVDNFIDLIH
jgi:hypothetical protein